MTRVLLWAEGTHFDRLKPALRVLARLRGDVTIVGIADECGAIGEVVNSGGGQVDIPKAPADPGAADLVLLTGNRYNYAATMRHLAGKGFDEERLIADRVLCVPGFTFEKYRRLRDSRLSIIAKSCFGGIMAHQFCLPFRTPIVNMYLTEPDYLAMLEGDPRRTLRGRLDYRRTEHQDEMEIDYPVYAINGFELVMNHYPDFDRARLKWYERLQSVNWYNLLVTMFTDDAETLARFDRLPFAKKVCFTSLESDLPSAYRVPPEPLRADPLWRVVNLMAYGAYFFYDLWDLLLYGKKTPLPEPVQGCHWLFPV